jgi:hypothetical protein
MPAPYNNLRSKLNRGICAYLIGQAVGTVANVLSSNSSVDKTYPLVTVQAVRGTPDPPLTGDYRCQIHVSVKGSNVQDPKQSPQANRILFDNLCAKTYDALMTTTDNGTLLSTALLITAAGRALATSDPTNNADMADFTVQNWFDGGFGMGDPDAEGCSWIEVFLFEAICCASNTD